MKFVKDLGFKRDNKYSKYLRYALFECPLCGEIVEKQTFNGKNQQSCGCLRTVNNKKHGRPTYKEVAEREEYSRKHPSSVKTKKKIDAMLSPRGINVKKSISTRTTSDRDLLYKYANSKCTKCKGSGFIICGCCKIIKRFSELHRFLLKYANPRCIKCLGTALLAWEVETGPRNKSVFKNAIICDCVTNQLHKGAGIAVGLTAEETLSRFGIPLE